MASPTLGADVYKCVVDGKTVFTDRPCVAGKKLDVQPNSVGEGDLTTIRAKKKEVDEKSAARIKREDEERASVAAYAARLNEVCQGHRDNIARQVPWLRSISIAARESAATEIEIQRRRMRELGC